MPTVSEKIGEALYPYYASARRIGSPETVDMMVRFLGTAVGTDKSLQLVENWSKLLAYWLRHPKLVRYHAEISTNSLYTEYSERVITIEKPSLNADRLTALVRVIGDARMLMRFTGLPGVIKGLLALLKSRPVSLLSLLQSISMLLYYPLEHAYYLASHNVITFRNPSMKGKLGLWSVRSWGAWVVLQLLKIRRDSKRLRKEEAALTTRGGEEEREIQTRRKALKYDLWLNLSYMPLVVHWSLEGGYFKTEFWPTLLGALIAGREFTRDWRANAVPAPVRQ